MEINQVLANFQKHKVFKTATIYVVASWVGLQAIAIIFPIVGLTQYYQRWFLLCALIGLPIALVFAWVKASGDTVKKKQRKRTIAWVVSILIGVAGLFFGSNVIGQPMTRIVAIENEEGGTERVEILKDEFVKSVTIFPFKNTESDGGFDIKGVDWIGRWIAMGINDDLGELNYINSTYPVRSFFLYNTLGEKQDFSRNNGDQYFVDGEFTYNEGQLNIKTRIYESTSLKLINQSESRVTMDLLDNQMDSISLQVRQWTGLPQSVIESEVDLPIAETLTSNDSARKYYAFENYQMAVYHDSTFATSAGTAASFCYVVQCGEEYSKKLIDLAMKHRERLGKSSETGILLMYYAINQQRDKAIKLLDNQLKLQPKNIGLLELRMFLSQLWGLEDGYEYFRRLSRIKTIPEVQYYAATISLINQKKYDQALELALEYQNNNTDATNWSTILGLIYMSKGEFQQALEAYELFELNNPDDKYIGFMIASANYHLNTPKTEISKVIQKVVGNWRYNYTELLVNVMQENHYLKLQGTNQAGVPYFLLNDSTFVGYFRVEDLGQFFKDEIIGREGEIDRMNHWQVDPRYWPELPRFPMAVLYREDSTLDGAIENIKIDMYAEAKSQLEEVLERHPSYRLISEYLSHIEFMTSEQYVDDRLLLNELEGLYGERQIYLEDGKLMYRRIGATVTSSAMIGRRLFPMEDNLVKLEGSNEFLMEVIKSGGNILGLRGWYWNPETEEYEPRESDFTPKEEQEVL